MSKQILDTPSAPAALGPYNVAVESAGLVFVSGQVALNPETGERAPDDIEVQTQRVLGNLGAILGDVGLGYGDVVKATVFLVDMADYPVFNEIYRGYFEEAAPARSMVQVGALPGGFLVEIEVIAARR